MYFKTKGTYSTIKTSRNNSYRRRIYRLVNQIQDLYSKKLYIVNIKANINYKPRCVTCFKPVTIENLV